MERFFENGLEIVERYFNNDEVSHRQSFLNGKLHGKEILFYENGRVTMERDWDNDKLNGTEVWYYENGQVKVTRNWINGVEVK